MCDKGPLFAALDYGTGGGKCAIFDAAGRRLGVAREAWSYEPATHEHAHLNPGSKFDPDAFWRALGRCSRRALAQAGIQASQLAAVSCTAQRLGTVFLDADRKEIYAAPNIDGRGMDGGFEVMETLDAARAIGITGHWPPVVFSLARLLAFQRVPGAPKVAHILTLNDWMTFRLSGELASEASNAGESMLLDITSRTWSSDILNLFGVDRRLLPPLAEPGSPMGSVTPEAADQTGFAVGTPVVVGGADTQCALLGASVVEVGQAAAVLGTTTPIMLVETTPRFDESGKLWSGCHVLADRWTIESNAGETGTGFEWLLGIFGLEGEDAYQRAENLIAAIPAGAGAVMGFAGPQIFDLMNYDSGRPAAFLFENPSFGVRPTAGSFLQAFLSNVAHATRANLEQVEKLRGEPAASLTLTGGMTRSDSLISQFQRILPTPLRISEEPDATALGAAILASVGCGEHSGVAQAAERMVRTRALERDAKFSDEGEADYVRWKSRYPLLGKLSG